MASFNKVIIAGNLTRDPELRATPSGMSICEIAIAINRKSKDKDGQTKEDTTFVGVKSFARTAEVIAEHFRKGASILVEGRLSQDQWEDKETGKKRSKTYVICDQFQFLDSKQGGGHQQQQQAPRAAAKPNAPNYSKELPADDDVPF
tara:strand:+ start:14569 stop:15009 length:441 start_codon:yes stop_codon:yes gene_type:complete